MTGGGARFRAALERFIEAAIDLLDALDEPAAELEDDEREALCEDEGVVDALTLEQVSA